MWQIQNWHHNESEPYDCDICNSKSQVFIEHKRPSHYGSGTGHRKHFEYNKQLNKNNMEVLTVANGIVQIVLVPQNEHEAATLRRLLEESPLEVSAVTANLNILGVPLQDGIIIRQKQKEVVNANG
jgi:hypothetical protein